MNNFATINEAKYLLDADVIRRTRVDLLNTDFIQKNCIVTDKVYHEISRSKKKSHTLMRIIVPTDRKVVEYVRNILIDQRISSLLSFSKNEGNGDIINLAYILSEQEKKNNSFFTTSWTLVTDDKGLKRACLDRVIPTIGTNELRDLIISSMTIIS